MKTLSYNQSVIHFGKLENSGFNDLLLSDRYRSSKKIIITDDNVYDLWMEHLIGSFESLHEAEIIQLPAGEDNKVLEICAHVWNALSEYEITRNDLIINIGGGVITDMGGFIAATFKRGLPFINIPTTLLAQVDASIGGKTGIDLGPYKNQIGVFADADHVFVDSTFLNTVSNTELISGYAEMLKHGLIADENYWNDLQEIDPTEEPEKMLDVIYRSVNLKKNIVEQDHKETGLRKHLNFGHTIGHAIEGYLLSQKTPVPHGYAVAKGMQIEAFISKELQLISPEHFNAIDSFIQSVYPSININKEAIPTLKDLLKNDKKNTTGQVSFTLLTAIGAATHDAYVSDEILDRAFTLLIDG